MEKPKNITVRGTDISQLRNLLRTKYAYAENDFLQELSDEARHIYETILPTSWLPQHVESEILTAGAKILFSDHEAPLRELCRQLAKLSMSSVFKIFLRIPSIPFLAKRIPYLWKAYFKQGRCEILDVHPHDLNITVRAAPGLSFEQLEEISGTIHGILDMTGSKNVRMTTCYDNPEAWEWHVEWT